MKDIKFYSMMNDTTFKYLFKNSKTRSFFNELIKYYTGLDITDFTFIDNELSSGNHYVSYRIDSLLTNKEEDIIINIELNAEYKSYIETRNRRYLHTIAGASKNKDDYNKKRRVIQLNLCGYKSQRDKNICNETFVIHDIENDIVEKDFEIHNVYIPKESEVCYNDDIKKKLKLFLCKSYEEMRLISGNDKELNDIVNELERLNQDKYFGALYNAEEEQEKLVASAKSSGFDEGHEMGMSKGHDLGVVEGRELEKRENIIKMYKEGIDTNTILKIVGLPKDEVESIIENSK